MNFNWRTDEEDWDTLPQEPRPNAAVPTSRLPLILTALAALLILSAAAFYIYRQALDQVDDTTTNLSGDLLAAYELLNSAVYQSDPELFQSFLSERNTYSRQLPLDLFRYGYYLDRPFLNLTAEAFPPPEEPAVTFSPDLTRAEVVALQGYRPTNDPEAGPIWLERQTLFRRDDDGRWQLTRWPVDEAFWGETTEERIGLLRVEYPARDEEIGRRLAADISALLDDICGHESINCPPNFRLKMLLSPYGRDLLGMNDNFRTLPLSSGYDAYRIFLPAPTLAGRPIDEAGYRYIYKGYAGWIAAVLVQHYSRIRPVTIDVTADFLAQWQLSPPPPPVLPGPLVENVAEPPLPFPDQDIHLVCQGYSPPGWLAYNPAGDAWRTISQPEDAPALAQLLQQAGEHARFAPEGQGTLIRRPFDINGVQSWHSYLWLGGLANRLESGSNPGLILADPRHQFPENGRLLFYPFDGQSNPILANADECVSGECRLQPLAGFPVWSPSGEKTLLSHQRGDGTPQIYLGDNEGRPLQFLNEGYAPEWLDEDSFYYINTGGSTLMKGWLDDARAPGRTETILAVEDLRVLNNPLIPQPLDSDYAFLTAAVTHIAMQAAHPNLVFLLTADPNTLEETILVVNLGEPAEGGSGAAKLFEQPNLQVVPPFHFTPDGRYLTFPTFDRGALSGSWSLNVFAFESDAGFIHILSSPTGTAYFDWSAGGEWLLVAEEDALRLIAPRHNYERQIPHTLGCHTTGWAEEGG